MFHRTERLLLRPFWPEDAAAVLSGINNPLILKNLSSPPCPYGLPDAQAFCTLPFDENLPNFAMIRRTKGAPELIGSIGLAALGDDAPYDGTVQIGYWVAQPFWGLGYASEAARAVLSIARSIGHRQLIGRHFSDNPASGRVLHKIGFRPTGRALPLHSKARATPAMAQELVCHLDALCDFPDGPDPDPARMMYYDSMAFAPLAA
jgi:RimJ/RimL family protein N-acetyltransferase